MSTAALAERASEVLASRVSRRSFVVRMAIAGSALAVGPLRYLLRPGTAYAVVCGQCGGGPCCDGYTEFCCVLNGTNACPPGIIGVVIGGNFEMSAVMAKRALMRKVGQPTEDPAIAELEAELYEKCNALGLGPEALGGTQTVLAVHVETMPTHIASLPVAVNIECHAHRTGTRVM